MATARAFALGEYSPKEGVDDRFKFQPMLDHFAFVAGETGGIKAIGKGFKKSEESMQIQKTMFVKLDIINVYRSQNGNQHELIEILSKMINKERFCIITGDFNLCGVNERRNVVTLFLERHGFSQMVQEATHIQGRVIDHIYVNDASCILEIERFSPYYSDHDGLLVSLDIKVIIIFFQDKIS